jgi:membrane-bound ClpP family serine protease
MKANMGSGDKLLRLLLAIVLILLFYFEVLTGTAGIIALIVALVLTVTSLINFCPLYPVFKINTCKRKASKVEVEKK